MRSQYFSAEYDKIGRIPKRIRHRPFPRTPEKGNGKLCRRPRLISTQSAAATFARLKSIRPRSSDRPMKSEYDRWLRAQGYDSGTVTAQLHRVGRVESYMGNVDKQYEDNRLDRFMDVLRYSTEDERQGRTNPTRIAINGNLRSNLASYRSAVALYRKFIESGGFVSGAALTRSAEPAKSASPTNVATPSPAIVRTHRRLS